MTTTTTTAKIDQDMIIRLLARARKGNVPVAVKALDTAADYLKSGGHEKEMVELVDKARAWIKRRGA